MRQVLSVNELELIATDISSEAVDHQLRGLQKLARSLEASKAVPIQRDLAGQIQSRFFSPVPKVRRWAFYCAALLKLTSAVVPLEYSVRHEQDAECRMWAWKAYVSLAEPGDVHALIVDAKFNYFGTPLELIPVKGAVDNSGTQLEFWERDLLETPVGAKWAGITYGYDAPVIRSGQPIELRKSLVRDLQHHEDVAVAEYAIWAFCNRRNANWMDLAIPKDQILSKSAGIRGWAYRLLLRGRTLGDVDDFVYDALAFELSKNEDPARRGLAEALKNLYWPKMENIIVPWAEVEDHSSVHDVLLGHMTRNASHSDAYVSYLRKLYSNEGSNEQRVIQAEMSSLTDGGNWLRAKIGNKTHEGDIVMGNKYNIGTVTGQVVNLGSINNSAIAAVQGMGERHALAPVKDDLQRMLHLLDAEGVDEASVEKAEAAQVIAELANADTSPSRQTLAKATSALRQLAEGIKYSGAVSDSARKIIEFLQTLL